MRSPLARTLLLAALAGACVVPATIACQGQTRSDGGEGLLSVGAEPPALAATAHDGQAIDLRALGGQPTVIYFYPKDNTPGCTAEACAFRDAWDRLQAVGIRVVGVSSDGLESHRAFAEEHGLPFPLVADEELAWARAFGVETKASYIMRVSFLIGRDGKIARVYPKVDPGVHAEQIITDVGALTG